MARCQMGTSSVCFGDPPFDRSGRNFCGAYGGVDETLPPDGPTSPRHRRDPLTMLPYLRKLGRRALDRGASAVEYGLLVAAIAAVIVGLVFGIGTVVQNAFQKTCNSLSAHNPGTTPANCTP